MKTPEDFIRESLHGYSDEQFNEAMKTMPLIEMPFVIKRYATQETKPLQERIDELEGALKDAADFIKSVGDDAGLADELYNTLKPQQ